MMSTWLTKDLAMKLYIINVILSFNFIRKYVVWLFCVSRRPGRLRAPGKLAASFLKFLMLLKLFSIWY